MSAVAGSSRRVVSFRCICSCRAIGFVYVVERIGRWMVDRRGLEGQDLYLHVAGLSALLKRASGRVRAWG